MEPQRANTVLPLSMPPVGPVQLLSPWSKLCGCRARQQAVTPPSDTTARRLSAGVRRLSTPVHDVTIRLVQAYTAVDSVPRPACHPLVDGASPDILATLRVRADIGDRDVSKVFPLPCRNEPLDRLCCLPSYYLRYLNCVLM